MSLIDFEDLPPCRQDGYDTIHRCVTQFGETEDDEIKFWRKKQLTTDSEYVRCVMLIGDPLKDIIFQFWGGIENCRVCSIFFPTMTIFNSFNGMHRFGVLFQQYCVDNWAKIQQNNLNFLYFNQNTLHASKYRNVQNRFLKGKSLDHAGYKLLPSSSYGTPRWLDQHCADSLSIVRHFGYVDYFITMTANRNWPEVRNALFLNNSSIDRADIVTRVFNLKVQVCDSDSLLH